jgi:glycosyltransferase involved in cell wall biosynthesis
MNERTPLISVILPVYNGEEHLSECIESVLSQTFKDFEFIIVDDASTDNTAQMLKEFAKKDKRINIVTHKVNQKQTVAANTACKYTKGKYIARMDADDIALPNRFMRQVTFLEENTKIGLLGSWVDIIDNNGTFLKIWYTHSTNQYLGWNLLFGASFAHSSVMMRRDCIEQVGFYQLHQAEDYDLWSRLSRITNVANLPEVLQQKRVWSGQLALRVVQNNRDCTLQIMQNNMQLLLNGISIDIELVKVIHTIKDKKQSVFESDLLTKTEALINQLYDTYISKTNLSKFENKKVTVDAYQLLFKLTNLQTLTNFSKGFIKKIYLAYRFPKLFIYSLVHRK